MGDGNVSSTRWDPERKLTKDEKIKYLQTLVVELKYANSLLDRENQFLAERLVKANRELSRLNSQIERGEIL